MSSIPRCEAASISITSSDEPFAIATHAWQVLSVRVGPVAQLSALARIRAIEVLPVPRGPAKMSLSDLAELDRVPQRPDDRLLPDDVLEVERAVLAVRAPSRCRFNRNRSAHASGARRICRSKRGARGQVAEQRQHEQDDQENPSHWGMRARGGGFVAQHDPMGSSNPRW